MSGFLEKAWSYSKAANSYWNEKTQPIKGTTLEEKVTSLCAEFRLSAQDQRKVQEILQQPRGKEFLEGRIDEVNRHATHHAAFMANAALHAGFVDLGSMLVLSFLPTYWLKGAFVAANLGTAGLALRQMYKSKNELLSGPEQAPRKTLLGYFTGGNRKRYNQYLKRKEQPYRRSMKNEKLYMGMYAANTIAPIFASQVLLSNYLPGPVSAIVNWATYVTATIGTVANGYWAYNSNRNVIAAATQRGNVLDKFKV